MIRVTVSGQTYDIKKRLKEMGFRWDRTTMGWKKNVPDDDVNHVIDMVRPPRSWSGVPTPRIHVEIEENEQVLGVWLKPAGERVMSDFLGLLRKENSVVSVSPNTDPVTPLYADIEKKMVDKHGGCRQ